MRANAISANGDYIVAGVDDDAGCFAVNYAIERHQNLTKVYISTIMKFAQSVSSTWTSKTK